jgi:hypothetical protein
VIPRTSPALLALFANYSKWYVARNFHSVRLSLSGGVPTIGNVPLVIYLNHASWWDPLIGLAVARKLWPSRQHYAPIDASSLARYAILSRIGFFGVEANTRRGAASFLKTSADILQSPSASIWITGEGQFRDPRTRPVELRPGLAHLARRSAAAIVPLAIEYLFWEERYPEVLCRFGATAVGSRDASVSQWTAQLAQGMRINQEALAAESIARNPRAFEHILRGRAGVGAIYDSWRWFLATVKGTQFHREHGEHAP